MQDSTVQQIAENFAAVRRQMAESARRARRDVDALRLIAVSKTFPVETIRAAYQAGLREFGENRVQEFQSKLAALGQPTLPDAAFHLIGHLQSNKASLAAGAFHWVQTIDGERLARRLDEAAGQAGKKLHVLIQVKLGEEFAQEDRKTGVAESYVSALAACLDSLTHLNPRGLMLIPPYTKDPEGARPYFRRLRTIAERLHTEGHAWAAELSMGMSHDFPIAIEEGATMIRVGTALFGPREPKLA